MKKVLLKVLFWISFYIGIAFGFFILYMISSYMLIGIFGELYDIYSIYAMFIALAEIIGFCTYILYKRMGAIKNQEEVKNTEQ